MGCESYISWEKVNLANLNEFFQIHLLVQRKLKNNVVFCGFSIINALFPGAKLANFTEGCSDPLGPLGNFQKTVLNCFILPNPLLTVGFLAFANL